MELTTCGPTANGCDVQVPCSKKSVTTAQKTASGSLKKQIHMHRLCAVKSVMETNIGEPQVSAWNRMVLGPGQPVSASGYRGTDHVRSKSEEPGRPLGLPASHGAHPSIDFQ